METGEQRDSLQLDYAPASAVRRTRRRRIVLFILLLVLTAATWKWGVTVRRQAVMLYWQRQCLAYSAPPDMVVYEEDPAAAAVLLAKDSDYFTYAIHRGALETTPSTVNAAAFEPKCYTRYYLSSGILGPTGFNVMLALGGEGAVVFLHERISASGHRRLVLVHYHAEGDSFVYDFVEGYNSSAFAIRPGTVNQSPVAPFRGRSIDVPIVIPRTPPLVRMFAGQIDPADKSHFTIVYQMWGKTDTLDGRLDDADNVTLTPRNLPQEPKR